MKFLSVSNFTLKSTFFTLLFNTKFNNDDFKSYVFKSDKNPKVIFYNPEYANPNYKDPLQSNQLFYPF